MQHSIILGDALEELKRLPDCCVDMCVTSPPYYALRDYGVSGQIGLEDSPEEFITKLVAVFREVHRVLKNDGTLWVNIADSYAGSGKGRMKDGTHPKDHSKSANYEGCTAGALYKTKSRCKRKDMIGIPWLLALALRDDGWYLRQDIIWQKPNAMPESVKDRCTRSHEYIFLLSKSPKYYFDAETIKEPAVGFDMTPPAGSRGTFRPNARLRKGNSRSFRGGGAYTQGRSTNNSAAVERDTHGNCINESGLRNRRDVWTVATKGCKDAHFATFPPNLIEPCILAGSPEGGVVLDPFLGRGTTAVVCTKLKRHCIGIELNEGSYKLAVKNCEEADQNAEGACALGQS